MLQCVYAFCVAETVFTVQSKQACVDCIDLVQEVRFNFTQKYTKTSMVCIFFILSQDGVKTLQE